MKNEEVKWAELEKIKIGDRVLVKFDDVNLEGTVVDRIWDEFLIRYDNYKIAKPNWVSANIVKPIEKRRIKMRFKTGDKVRVKKDLVTNEEYGDDVFVSGMVKYLGKETEIDKIEMITIDIKCYRLKIDSGTFNWTDEMLELVEERKTK